VDTGVSAEAADVESKTNLENLEANDRDDAEGISHEREGDTEDRERAVGGRVKSGVEERPEEEGD
jgi:hypothetical protein